MELLNLLSTKEILAHIVAFLILVYILNRFLWKRFLTLLDERRQKISRDIGDAEEKRLEMEEEKALYIQKLSSIEEEARVRFRKAADDGKILAEEFRQKAQDDSKKFFEKARESIDVEILKAKEELKDEIVELVIDTAGKVVQEKLSVEEDRKIVEEFLKRVDNST